MKTKDHQGHNVPVWRTLYPAIGREGYPPVAVVFNPGTRLGAAGLKNRMSQVMELTRVIWSGSYESMGPSGGGSGDGYYDYADAILVLFTTLERLKARGPRPAVWWRCGHGRWEDLPAALANPNDADAWHARDEERRLALEEQLHQEHGEAARLAAAWGRQAPVAARTGDQHPGAAQSAGPAVPAPCERCGQPVTGPPGEYHGDAVPSEDGRHCPTCRTDLAQLAPRTPQSPLRPPHLSVNRRRVPARRSGLGLLTGIEAAAGHRPDPGPCAPARPPPGFTRLAEPDRHGGEG
ncbi:MULTISPECIES: hypothetical protein [Streptomyces]|uniref:hypothetical protein n=1 Tax=Streptomyces TaxID=1883 RepID=UPI0033C5792F